MKNKKSVWFHFLLVAFLIGISVGGNWRVLTSLPSGHHAWTQADHLALCEGFRENPLDILHPKTNNLIPPYSNPELKYNDEGITKANFPLPHLLAGLTALAVGSSSPAIPRIVWIMFSILGVFWFYRILVFQGLRHPLAIALSLLAFCSPVYFYFQASLIPSVPGLSLLIGGLYYFLKWNSEGRRIDWTWTVLLFLLATLIRPPMGIVAFVVICSAIFSRGVARMGWLYLELIVASGLFLLNFWHESALSESYGSMFLTSPEWPSSFSEAWGFVVAGISTNGHSWLSLGQMALLGLLIIFSWRGGRGKQGLSVGVVLGSVILTFVYMMIMSRQLVHHDYYGIDIFIPLFLITIIQLAGRYVHRLPKSNLALMVMLPVCLLLSISESINHRKQLQMPNSNSRSQLAERAFQTLPALLAESSIPSSARLLFLDAYSNNLPLLYAQHRGFTVVDTRKEHLDLATNWPWDFCVTLKETAFEEVFSKKPDLEVLLEIVGENERLSIYKRGNGFRAIALDLVPEYEQFDDPVKVLETHKLDLSSWIIDGAVDSTTSVISSSQKFPATFKATLHQYKTEAVSISIELSLFNIPTNARLVCTTNGNFYREIPRLSERPSLQKYKILIDGHFLKKSEEVKIYLWNPDAEEIQFSLPTIQISEAKPM